MLGHYAESNFNCTIQELKHIAKLFIAEGYPDFNCTIQELKRILDFFYST